MRPLKYTIAILLIGSTLLYGQGLPIKSGLDTNLATVDANKNMRVTFGPSTRGTYYATAIGLVTTALFNLTIEAPAATGFKLINWCVGVSNATAAAAVSVTVNRRTTASSAGTLVTNEATATPSMSKADPADGNYAGVVRVTSTLGTIGALLDGTAFQVGTIAGGNALTPFCKSYTGEGAKAMVVAAGATNGISINVSAPGAGGLAAGAITATVIVE